MKFRLAVFSLLALLPTALWCQTVRFRTNVGDIDVNLLPTVAPKTVENFLGYMNSGAYNNSIIHRSVPGFIIQGGGYQLQKPLMLIDIPQGPPVRNEFSLSNARGTIAMAKLDGNPNSATNQWFFNLADNSGNLNNQNGGFTVFGRVANSASLAVMDKIAALKVYYANAKFDQLPLFNYSGGDVQDANFVLITSISLLEPSPVINPNGIITASTFGAFAAAAPGSFIEIYGSNLAGTTRQWSGDDFKDGNAPTSLDNVSVSIAGQAAYVYSISPGQVNVQVPAAVPAGGPVPVIVTYKGQASAAVMLTINPVQGGLFAPPSFNVGGKQYAAAIHSSSGAFVSDGTVPGVPAAPARPGETLVFYGIGFGPVTPAGTAIAGQVAQGQSSLATAVQFKFGDTPAQAVYAGLAPGLVGLYQFNVVVPAVESGIVPLTITLGGTAIQQTLFIPVQR
ncbi:MAG TPA: peptidylprolyl isomerase [Bryobacteraceae bacterium]|nr:peptidylprolyl isomerase [Bryobacteraceae bacterium]